MILSTKKRFLRRAFFGFFVFGVIICAVLSFANKTDEQDVLAASEDGDRVTLEFTASDKIYYGQRREEEDHQEEGDRGATHWFKTNTQYNGRYDAYCAQPTKKPLAGTFEVRLLDDNDAEIQVSQRNIYKAMKLMIFAATNGGPGADDKPAMKTEAARVMNYLFDSSTLSQLRISSTTSEQGKRLIYAYTHAVLGLLYDVDYTGTIVSHELGNEESVVRGIKTKLENIVNGTVSGYADAYLMSQTYNLYTVDRHHPIHVDISDYSPEEYQDIVWIESPEAGKVVLRKHDTDTYGPQGDADLSGIVFRVKNNTGRRIYDPITKAFYNDGDVMREVTTNASGEARFELPLGKFSVYEYASKKFYRMTDTTVQSIQILEYRSDEIGRDFSDKVRNEGKVTVEKHDKDNGECSPAGKASLADSKFSLYNMSSQPIYYNNTTIPHGGKIDTKTVAAGECSVTFTGLPAGTYEVREDEAGTGYVKNPDPKTAQVTLEKTQTVPEEKWELKNGSATIPNEVYRGNIKFKKVDQNDNNSPMANVAFKITSSKGESHIVVTNSDGEVDTSAIDHNRNTNKYDAITNPGDYVYHSDWGTWFYGAASAPSDATIDNTRGALPYDTYTLTEVSCPTNEFCYDVGDWSLPFTINENKTTPVDLGNLGGNTGAIKNDCVHHEIATTASDPVDDDKYILVGEEVTVRDRVAYHAMRGKSYTVRGTLYDAETGLPLNSTQSKSFSIPENGSEDGYVDLDFTFDSTEYAGHSIVVFEELVYDNRVVAEHKELTDEEQTVYVIDFGTTAVDDADGDKYIANEENMTIEDTIDYCLVAHQSFRFVAHLYDKTTDRLLVNSNGDVIEYSLDVTPETACGAAVIELGFNAKGLEGHHIVVFEKLYHEDDLIMTHEDKEDEDQTVYVIGFGTTAVDQEDRDKYVIDGDLVTIRDRIRYCLVADRTFTVSAYLVDKATGQPIEGGEGEIVSRTYTFVPNTDCGSFVATFKVNASKLAGHDLVAFERVLDDGKVVLTHEDIEDQNETVRVISLQTFATSNQDEIDELDEDSEIVITDLVKYCLKANNEFTFVGKLYDKDSGQQLVIDGTPVEQSYTFTPKKDCGEFELTYKFPAKGMAKKEFVILEELYDDFGRRILLREDLDNEDETVRLPDTGYMIKADGGVDGGSNPAVIALLGILVTAAFVIVRGFAKTIIGTRKAF